MAKEYKVWVVVTVEEFDTKTEEYRDVVEWEPIDISANESHKTVEAAKALGQFFCNDNDAFVDETPIIREIPIRRTKK